MILSHHPFQRAGAWAGCAIAGKAAPSLLDAGDLDGLAAMITADATAAALAAPDGPGYAWWKVLFAAYPNSPAAHAARARWSRDAIGARIADLFAPDDPGATGGPCDLCGTPASRRWAKSLRPLAASGNHVNNQPAGGWPACRDCRIALWLLPYASASNGTLMLTCGTVADEALEAGIARHCVSANREAIGTGLAAWPDGPEWMRPVLDAIIEHPRDAEVLRWRNDNKHPFIVALRRDEQTAIRLAAWEALAGKLAGQPRGDIIRALADDHLRAMRNRDWFTRTATALGYGPGQISRLAGAER